jgi:hypothetical protein
VPSLDWATIGYTVGAKSAVAIGAKAKVTIKGPVGPTCTLKVHYPSGGSPSLPAPTHPSPGWWVWTWTVKSSAGTGTATFNVGCTYAGLKKSGDGDFTIVNVPAPDGWTISVSTITSRSKDSSAPMMFTVHVHGVVPQDPETQIVEMACYYRILVVNGPPDAWIYDLTYFAPDAQFEFSVDVGVFGAANVGSRDWVIRCTNSRWMPFTYHEDSGSIEVY